MSQSLTANKRSKAWSLAVFTLPILMLSSAQAQNCNSNMIETTPTSDFAVHGDGTVTNQPTQLMWKVCSEGQTWSANSCSGSTSTKTWSQALQIPSSLNAGAGFAGHTDWRLPNIKELKTLVEFACFGSAINETVFPSSAAEWYWSSSPSANDTDVSWALDVDSGDDFAYTRTSVYRVRLVRTIP